MGYLEVGRLGCTPNLLSQLLFFVVQTGKLRTIGWSGRGESNSRRKLGKLLLCH